jgi:hydroxypyruvate isomerase
MDGELLATYRRLKDRIAHVQIADNPGRHEPGTGEVNYPFLFESVRGARPRGVRGLDWL